MLDLQDALLVLEFVCVFSLFSIFFPDQACVRNLLSTFVCVMQALVAAVPGARLAVATVRVAIGVQDGLVGAPHLCAGVALAPSATTPTCPHAQPLCK